MIPTPKDPFWRAVFLRTLLAGLLVAVAGTAGWRWGAGMALVTALILSVDLVRRVGQLRAKVLELAGEPSASPADLPDLARRVDAVREELERTVRKAKLERDDLLGVLEATSEGILVLGHHHRVELINDAARRLIDPPVDPLGRSLHELTRHPELLDFAEALRRGKSPTPVRIELAHPGGTRSIHLAGEAVRGTNLRSRAVLVLHDLTDLQRLERVRTDFVANVTHEMRSPLASILGYAETLAADGSIGSADARDGLERILRNSRRLDGIIRDLIDLSRLEHAAAPRLEQVSPQGLVQRVASEFRDQAAAKGIEIVVAGGREPFPIELDSALVHQALTNLVDNAVKYTPAGGRVTIASTLTRDRAQGRSRLELAVADTGPGIPPEHRSRIFERFYRVDPARSRALGGTGLGLAIVKHAAALHGGRVRLESGPEQGATFRIELPVTEIRPA